MEDPPEQPEVVEISEASEGGSNKEKKADESASDVVEIPNKRQKAD